MFNFKKPQSVIGFDLGLEKLNMVQVTRVLGQTKIQAAVSDYHNASYDLLLAEPERMKKLVKRALASSPFLGRTVVSSMPNTKLQLLFLNYPCKPGQNEAEALLTALATRVNSDLREFVIDYVPIKPVIEEHQARVALVALAKKEDAENYLDLLNKCGLQVAALEIGPVAIRRLLNAMTSDAELEKVMAINFGTQKSFLTVLWDGDILLDRPLNFGLESILQALGQAFDIDHKLALKMVHDFGLAQTARLAGLGVEEEIEEDVQEDVQKVIHDVLTPTFARLAEEIREVLLYIASETRGGAVERIYLLGSVARLRGLEQVIDQLISIPVKVLNPFYGFAAQDDLSDMANLGPLSGIAVATGSALRSSK
ncbi:MAG: pilus assembly protein PilM [Methylococcales bacterium]